MWLLRSGLLAVVAFAICKCAWGQTNSEPNPGPKPLTVEIKPMQVYKGHSFQCTGVDISPDGRLLVSAGNQRLRLWNLKTGKQVAAFDVVEGDNTDKAVFSPDGKILACTCGDGCTVHLLATASGKVLKRIGPLPTSATLVAVTPDGKRLLTVCNENCLRVWDVNTGEEIKKSRLDKLDGDDFTNAALCPDCRRIAIQVDEYTCVVDVESGKEVCRLTWLDGENGPEGRFIFSPDGRYLTVPVRWAPTIRLWDLTTGKAVRDITWEKTSDPKSRKEAYAVSFSADGKALLANCYDGRTRVWEVATGGLRYQTEKPIGFIPVPRSSLMVSANSVKGTLEIWDSLNPAGQQPAKIAATQMAGLWGDLGEADSGRAFQALTTLVVAPDDAVALIGRRLKAVEPVDDAKLDRLIADLDEDKFETREAASQKLEKLRELAKGKLVAALEQSPSKEASRRIERLLERIESPDGADWRRALRALEVLEAIRTPAARQLLQDLAKGASAAPLTEQAKASLNRLKSE